MSSRSRTARSSWKATCSTQGFRPAINAGLSVSRVGGAAQTKIIKKLGGGVRLALAQYRELAAFSQFASDLDEQTRKQLERGERVMELMKQPQYTPLTVADMAVSLFAVDQGYVDDVEVGEVVRFEKGHARFHAFAVPAAAGVPSTARVNTTTTPKRALRRAVEDFKAKGTW